jgi:hypothetical protein
MRGPKYLSLFQINTRVWLTELSRGLGRRATLDDIPNAELDRVAGMGFDWVWLLSVWRTGLAGQRVSRGNPEWRKEFQDTLPDLREEDIAGSGFAITGYTVHPGLGGDAETIVGYLGSSDQFDTALARYSVAYANHGQVPRP